MAKRKSKQTETITHFGEEMMEVQVPDKLPVLPLRATVVFPGTVVPLSVGRKASRKLLLDELPDNNLVALMCQKDPSEDEPQQGDFYRVGTVAMVLKTIHQPDGTLSVIVQGIARFSVRSFMEGKHIHEVKVKILEEKQASGKRHEAAMKNLRETALELINLTPNVPEQAPTLIINIEDAGNLADFMAANMNINTKDRQALLEELDIAQRVKDIQLQISKQLDIALLQEKIQEDVLMNIDEMQRKVFLREQMQAIQRELGEGGEDDQVLHLHEQLLDAEVPKSVMKEAQRELKRLNVVPPASPEYSVITSYLETIAQLPWAKSSEDNLDLVAARKILDRDHYDLEKIKKRLIEYLAVKKLNPEGQSPILCFVGPPGVGKTSLGQSIADALGRKFARMSLGGLKDEAEIRGHRRTYIGAMPGRIIQELRKLGTNNPVIMLDEIDKVGSDFRGDPASALLEVLDPKQNDTFTDRYMDVPFDLSNVMFIATANYLDPVPPALLDRMEVIELPGYTLKQKSQIARRYLVPRQLKSHGLPKKHFKVNAAAIEKVIDDYTREAGVRNLERQIGALCRSLAAEYASETIASKTVDPQAVRDMLGPEKFLGEEIRATPRPGVVTGLAYTPVGGEILHIEAVRYPGKGNIKLTGQIGDVMKESATAALTLIRTRAEQLGIKKMDFEQYDIHIHVPAGAIPKDGPSAGVAMVTALTSLFTDQPVPVDLAMTGEITLRGKVMAIGGLKEKTLAAMRAGVKKVIVPEQNKKDMEEISPEVKRKLKFVFVSSVDELLKAALG